MNTLLHLTFLLTQLLFIQSCVPNENFCLECHSLANICIKCQNNLLTPDENGECVGVKKCSIGENYCIGCNDQNTVCQECETGYYPDENGACSYTENCEISYNGKCLKCKQNFLLVGDSVKVCKNLNLDNLKNCKNINNSNGLCEECEENYYLTKEDNKCIEIDNCKYAVYGVCQKCVSGFYLDKKNDKCVSKTSNTGFEFCKISIDGESCAECDDGYFFSHDVKCVSSKFCITGDDNGKCQECNSQFYMTTKENTCTSTKNCYLANQETANCVWCNDDLYYDKITKRCKPNTEDDDFKFCGVANEKCIQCDRYHYLGKDNKCSGTRYCTSSENGKCLACENNYYIGLDNKCSNIEKCIYSNSLGCLECEDGYYFNKNLQKCVLAEKNFVNCKLSDEDGNLCAGCKNNYYLNRTDLYCYDNTQEGPFYKCAFSLDNGTFCQLCEGEYYIGREDLKCNLIQGCLSSESVNKCTECDYYYYLNQKTGNCIDNYYIENEEMKKFYYCKKSNLDGTACEECEEGHTLNDDGLCVNFENCEEKDEDGNCVKCVDENPGWYPYFCLNKIYGCVNTFLDNCLLCEDEFNLDRCSKCKDGYEIDEDGECQLVSY